MTSIGDYSIQRQVHGARKPAYIATRSDKTVFLKLPENFEVDALKTVSHPNVVRLEDLVTVPGTAQTHIALEYVQGKDLFETVSEDADLHEHAYYPIALQLAKALAAIHDSGFVYHDMKPENVMVTPSGQAKIVDLGSCTPTGLGSHSVGTTPGYRSAEQIRKENMIESDVFGLGAVMYFMVYGKDPVTKTYWGEMTRQEEMLRLSKKLPKQCHPDPETSYMVRKMLSCKPRERPRLREVEEFLNYKIES